MGKRITASKSCIPISLAYNEDDLKYLTRKVNKDIEKTYLKFESAITEEKVISKINGIYFSSYIKGEIICSSLE